MESNESRLNEARQQRRIACEEKLKALDIYDEVYAKIYHEQPFFFHFNRLERAFVKREYIYARDSLELPYSDRRDDFKNVIEAAKRLVDFFERKCPY